jgi:integrase
MASLRKRPNSPYWYICYRLGNRRVQVSSGTTDKHRATQMAWAAEGLGVNWSRVKALALVEEIASVHGQTISDPAPLSEFMANWRKTQEPDWSESSIKTFRAVEKGFLAHVGSLTLGQVGAGHITSYRDGLMTRGRSRRTVAQHIKYLRRVFRSALEAERIPSDPTAGIGFPAPRPSKKQPFTMSQFRALLNKTDGEWHLLVLVAGLTGQRLNDVLALTHDDIDTSIGTVRFKRRKNKDFHYVPLHPSLATALPDGFGKLFPELDALPKTGSRSVSAKFREQILPMIGIVQEYGHGLDGNRQVTQYSFHSFRHMLSTELNRIGASPETRMAIVGHDDKKVSAGYTHADLDTAKQMLERVVV